MNGEKAGELLDPEGGQGVKLEAGERAAGGENTIGEGDKAKVKGAVEKAVRCKCKV